MLRKLGLIPEALVTFAFITTLSQEIVGPRWSRIWVPPHSGLLNVPVFITSPLLLPHLGFPFSFLLPVNRAYAHANSQACSSYQVALIKPLPFIRRRTWNSSLRAAWQGDPRGPEHAALGARVVLVRSCVFSVSTMLIIKEIPWKEFRETPH